MKKLARRSFSAGRLLTRIPPTLVGLFHSFHLLFSSFRGRGKAKPPSPLNGLAAMLLIARGFRK
jgi:hypothetical protein